MGCPRSGTTLLQTLLDAHPNIAIPPESHLFRRFAPLFPRYGDLQEESNRKLLVKDLLNDVRIREWHLELSVEEFCARLKNYSLREIVSVLFEAYAEKEGKIHWGDKTPSNVLFLPQIKSLFPEAKVIHLVRDGRDVAESLSRALFGTKSIDTIAYRWKESILAFRQFVARFGQEDSIEVKYEDLANDPQHEISKILDFFEEGDLKIGNGIPDTPTRSYYIQKYPVHQMLREPVSNRKVGIFLKKMKSRKIEIFETIAGNLLESYGYHCVTARKAQIQLWERISFFLSDYCLRYLRKLTNFRALGWDLKQAIQIKTRQFSFTARRWAKIFSGLVFKS